MTARTICKDLLLLTLLLSGLFTYLLGNHPLTVPDEARYCEIPREMLVTQHYVTPRINGIQYFEKPPLFYWMQAASLHWLGLSPWSCRFMNAMVALCGCLLTYLAATSLYNRKTGWFSALILSTSLLYFILSRTVTLDMTLTLLMTVTLYALLLGLQHTPTNRWRRSLFYVAYAAAALAVLTKGLIGLLFPGSIVLLWLIITKRWHELKHCYLFSGTAIFLVITLPWHYLIQSAHPKFFHYYFIRQQFSRYLTNVAHRYQPLWFYPSILMVGFFPWVGFLYGVFKKTINTDNTTIFLTIWPAFILIFFCFSHSKLVPYLLPCFPPLAILVAHYFATYEHKTPTMAGWVGFSVLIVMNTAITITLMIMLVPEVTNNYAKAITGQHHIVLILMANSIIVPLLYKQGRFLITFSAQFIFTIIFLLLVCEVFPFIALPSVQTLASQVKPLLKPNTVVASYDYYYQDLPFYLRRYISIVNWQGELAFGAEHQSNKSLLMIDSAQLWQYWQKPANVYLFMPVKIWQNIVKPLPYHFYIFAEKDNNIVVTNHRIIKP